MHFTVWERVAYIIDVNRIWPRSVLLFYAWMSWEVGHWFMALKDPTLAQAGYPSVVFGVIPLLLNFYSSNGVDWTKYRFPEVPPK